MSRAFRSHLPLAVGLLAAMMAACSDPTSPRDVEGTWGAENVRLVITVSDALFDTPCYSGRLTMPLQFGNDGRFDATGLLTRQGGAGGNEQVVASFRGHVRGDRLSLAVGPANLGLGPHELQRDAIVDIIGCP